MSEEFEKLWDAIHELQQKINRPYFGPMIEDDPDEVCS